MVKNINAAGQYGNSQFTVSGVPGQASYSSIQNALDDINGASETIFIYPGTCTESITWPANISVEGATHGEEVYDVIINGNQTFEGSGNISFKNIGFTCTSGDCWNLNSVAGAGAFEFIGCEVEALSGKGIVAATTVGTFTLMLNSTNIEAATQAIEASGNTILDSDNSIFSTSSDNINTIDLSGNASFNLKGSTLNTSGIGAGSCLSLNSSTSSIDSRNTLYNAGNAANASAFLFTVDGGFVRSVKDEMFIAVGSFWARSTGAFGTLSYGSIIINTGTTSLIDPQITATPLIEIPSDSITIPVVVAEGGTGAITLADGGIVLGSGTDPVTVTAQPTDGQILVGTTGADPTLTTLTGGTGISVVNAAGSIIANLDTPVSVPDGGTGAITLEDGGIVLGSGTAAVTITAQPTDGQLLIGSTGLDPVLATLTQGTGCTLTIGAGSITIDVDVPVTVAYGGTGLATLTDGGIILGSGTTPVTVTAQPTDGQLLIGSTGADPALSTLTQGPGMTITNASGGVTLASTAVVWSVQVTGTTLAPNEGFISTAGIVQVFPLPSTAVIGEVFEVAQNGNGAITISQIAGQSIRFGNQVTTTGVGGFLLSSSQGDSIKLVCTATNTDFQVVGGAIGNWSVS